MATLASASSQAKSHLNDPLWAIFKFRQAPLLTEGGSCQLPALPLQHGLHQLNGVQRIQTNLSSTNSVTWLLWRLNWGHYFSLNIPDGDNFPKAKGTFKAAGDDLENLPVSIDWRQSGAVTSVKSQGKCGSCWSVSATGALEGQLAKKKWILRSLSEQNLVTVQQNTVSPGSRAFSRRVLSITSPVVQVASIPRNPYNGTKKQCQFNHNSVGAYCQGFNFVNKTEIELQAAVARVGPVSVAIDATRSFLSLAAMQRSIHRQGM